LNDDGETEKRQQAGTSIREWGAVDRQDKREHDHDDTDDEVVDREKKGDCEGRMVREFDNTEQVPEELLGRSGRLVGHRRAVPPRGLKNHKSDAITRKWGDADRNGV